MQQATVGSLRAARSIPRTPLTLRRRSRNSSVRSPPPIRDLAHAARQQRDLLRRPSNESIQEEGCASSYGMCLVTATAWDAYRPSNSRMRVASAIIPRTMSPADLTSFTSPTLCPASSSIDSTSPLVAALGGMAAKRGICNIPTSVLVFSWTRWRVIQRFTASH